MDGTILNKKYKFGEKIDELEEKTGDLDDKADSLDERVTALEQGGGGDKNVWNLNNGEHVAIGTITVGQNTYTLQRGCFDPPYPMWIQANQEVANFLNPAQCPFPLDNRCIKFYIFDTNNRNITEMAVIERSTGYFMKILKSFNTETIQVGKFVVEYYEIPAASESKKSTKKK